eukprot:2814694-Rhodomonas_salina.1
MLPQTKVTSAGPECAENAEHARGGESGKDRITDQSEDCGADNCSMRRPDIHTTLESLTLGDDSANTQLPAGLEGACDAAMAAYVRSESGAVGVRYCNGNNASVFWSGADPSESERSPPAFLQGLLAAPEVAACFAAAVATGRREPVDVKVCTAVASAYYDAVYSAEHVASYLHRDGHFASQCPVILDKLVGAMSANYPGLPGIQSPLHVRCIELHTYSRGGALATPEHRDNGSKRTLIVQLSRADEFDGGRFVTWHEGEPVVHQMQLGDGLLINSEKMHNVAPVTRGVRNSLVIELWVPPANKHDRFR